MNSVIIDAFRHDLTFTQTQTNAQESYNVTTYSQNIVNYATFEGAGIDLNDTSLVFAQASDKIGLVSTTKSDANGAIRGWSIKISISEETAIPMLTIKFTQNYIKSATVKWYQYETEFSNTFVNNQGLIWTIPLPSAELASYVEIVPTETEIPNQFVKIAEIGLGEQYTITEFEGSIELFCDSDPTCCDLPSGTIDFTCKCSSAAVPREGYKAIVYHNDELFGTYIIESSERIAKDLYVVRGYDAIGELDYYVPNLVLPYEPSSESVQSLCEKILENSPITCESFPVATVSNGYIAEGDTARTALAKLSQFLANYHTIPTAFKRNTLAFKAITETVAYTITADDIFGNAEVKKTATNKTVSLNAHHLVDGQDEIDGVNSVQKAVSGIYQPQGGWAGDLSVDVYLYKPVLSEDATDVIAEWGSLGSVTFDGAWRGWAPGDYVAISTPYDGLMHGIVKSVQLSLGKKKITAQTEIRLKWGGS